MGASNSRLEEDKGLQLCRARKKFIKQALNGRCSLASAHIAYVEELKIVGIALRRFVDNDHHRVDSFAFARSETSEHRVLTEKPLSQSSLSSRSLSHLNNTNISPSPSRAVSVTTQYQAHRMNFRGMFSRKVEVKPPENVTATVTVSSNTPPLSTPPRSIEAREMTTPRSIEAQEVTTPCSVEAFENPSASEETAPWDYFGLFHPIDSQFSTEENKGFDTRPEDFDEARRNHKVDESVGSDLSDAEEQKLSLHETDESEVSEDEFDEPSLSNLVRSFNNVNRFNEKSEHDDDPHSPLEDSEIKESESSPKNVNEIEEVHVTEEVVLETKAMNGDFKKSPQLSPLRSASSRIVHVDELKMTPMKQDDVEDKVFPKDFVTSMKDIEQLFIKASGSGIEVPKMLEANKFHFRPIVPGRERESITSFLLRSLFSCGQDPNEVPPEPPQNSVKYLTWHRTTSSRSASSRNLLGATNASSDGHEEPSDNLFDNFCMISGSHASTLDRLYAWEKKLYDEVKAGQVLRSHFDQKCKLLRHQESRGEKTDKTRAVVKDLHSRIRVAIHRIDSISKKIEEIRDKELQPQLEELIEGFKKMWETMLECHRLQFHIISISHTPTRAQITLQTDSHRQITIHLENELGSLSSTFTKWISAQKIYLEAIDKWLYKCVSLPQKTTKRNKRMKPPPIRNIGPPIYMLCGAWMEKIDKLPSKAVVDSIKDLASEVASFLPRQEKNQGKSGNHGSNNIGDLGNNKMLGDEDSWDVRPRLDRFKTSFAGFLGQLSNFAESSVKMFGELQIAVEEAKSNYEQFKSQQ